MRSIASAVARAALLGVLALLAGCDPGIGGEPADGSAAAGGLALRPEYVREYVFLGVRGDEPVVVPFAFRAAQPAAGGVDRVARAWLAHGATWEGLVEERWRTSGAAGVWQVLPRGELRLTAVGPSEVESLWIAREGEGVRVQLGAPLSGWVQGEDARFRVQQGRLTLADEIIPGAALELLKVERARRGGSEPADWIFLAGDSLRMVLARVGGARDRFGTTFGWIGRPGVERGWEAVEIEWREARALSDAGRDIPLRWGFRIPEAGVSGEVRALGYDVVAGAERAGRRPLEARYTVEGWVEMDGSRSEVAGMVRHSQR